MTDPINTQMNAMDEAEVKVMYRNFLKLYGRIQLLQCIDTLQKCTVIALEVVKESFE